MHGSASDAQWVMQLELAVVRTELKTSLLQLRDQEQAAFLQVLHIPMFTKGSAQASNALLHLQN
jgi:hypothetical protein